MTTGMIVFWVVIGLLVVFVCWLMIQAKHPIDAPEENNEAPYKLEPAEQLAVSKQPKKRGRPVRSKNKQRRYTKRSLSQTKTKTAQTHRKQNRKIK